MKTKTGDSYHTAQEMDEERKASVYKMVATELLKLPVETDEERKARLKKMVATTQFRLTLYYVFENSKTKRNDLARPVMGTIFLVYVCRSVGMSVVSKNA